MTQNQGSDSTFDQAPAVPAIPAERFASLNEAFLRLSQLVAALRPMGEAVDALERAQPEALFAEQAQAARTTFETLKAAEATAYDTVTDYSSTLLRSLGVQLNDIVIVQQASAGSEPDTPSFSEVRLRVESSEMRFEGDLGYVVLSGAYADCDNVVQRSVYAEALLTPGSRVLVAVHPKNARSF